MGQPADKTRVQPVVVGRLAAAVVLIAFSIALSVLGTRGENGVEGLLQEGGWGIWALFALTALGTRAIVKIAARQNMSRRSWAVALAMVILPIGLAVVYFEWSRMQQSVAISDSMEPSQQVPMLATGMSEDLVLSIVGGVAILSMLSATTIVLGARALSRAEVWGFGFRLDRSMGAGLVALIVAFAMVALCSGAPLTSLGFSALPVLAVLTAVTLVGKALDDHEMNEDTVAEILGDLLLAGSCGVVGVLMAATVVHGMGQRLALSVLGDHGPRTEDADLGLFDGLRESAGAIWQGVFLMPIAVAVVAVFFTRRAHFRAVLQRAWLDALAPLAVGALLVLVFVVSRLDRLDTLATVGRSSSADLALPEVAWPRWRGEHEHAIVAIGQHNVKVLGTRVVGTAELTGVGCQEVAKQLSSYPRAIAIDRSVSYGKVACIWRAYDTSGRRAGQVDILVGGSKHANLPAPWNELGAR